MTRILFDGTEVSDDTLVRQESDGLHALDATEIAERNADAIAHQASRDADMLLQFKKDRMNEISKQIGDISGDLNDSFYTIILALIAAQDGDNTDLLAIKIILNNIDIANPKI